MAKSLINYTPKLVSKTLVISTAKQVYYVISVFLRILCWTNNIAAGIKIKTVGTRNSLDSTAVLYAK